jgi:hypothetical protein
VELEMPPLLVTRGVRFDRGRIKNLEIEAKLEKNTRGGCSICGYIIKNLESYHVNGLS